MNQRGEWAITEAVCEIIAEASLEHVDDQKWLSAYQRSYGMINDLIVDEMTVPRGYLWHMTKRVILGCDHAGFLLKERIKTALTARGLEVVDKRRILGAEGGLC